MIRKRPAPQPTEAGTSIDAALCSLLDHVGRLLAEDYVALVSEDSGHQMDALKKR
jgi:hypothetical protein